MKWIRRALPHLTIAFAIALLTVAILNEFNPRMGFLQGRPALVLICAACLCAAACGAVLYSRDRREK